MADEKRKNAELKMTENGPVMDFGPIMKGFRELSDTSDEEEEKGE